MMKLKIYQDRKDEWRWQLIARNGQIVAVSGEGYTRPSNCKKIMKKIFLNNEGVSRVIHVANRRRRDSTIIW